MESRTAKKAAGEVARPPFEEMIKTAIISLKERTGSTMASILKFIQVTWPNTDPKVIRSVARRMVKLGELIKTRTFYKLSKKEVAKELKAVGKPRKGYRKAVAVRQRAVGRRPVGGRRRKTTRLLKKRNVRKQPKVATAKKSEPEVIIVKEEPKVEKSARKPRKAKIVKSPRKPRVYRRRSALKKQYVRRVKKIPKVKMTKRRVITKRAPKARKVKRVPKTRKTIKKLTK